MSVFSQLGMHGTAAGGVTIYSVGDPGQGHPDYASLAAARSHP
jgi:hypothetical protein